MADEKVTVIACTEENMHAGGMGPLPSDPRAKHTPTDEEKRLLVAMFQAFDALRRLGWREAIYAPRDAEVFLSIEAGSTGIHECSRDADGDFWLYDGNVWPGHPILWKPLERAKEGQRGGADDV